MELGEVKSYVGKFGLLRVNGRFYLKEMHGWVVNVREDAVLQFQDNEGEVREFPLNNVKSFTEVDFKSSP